MAHAPVRDPAAATVVIATRDRPQLLARGLAALAAQRTAFTFAVLVVDDGSTPPLEEDPHVRAALRATDAAWTTARVLRERGGGPARARNRGIRESLTPLVLFTDDDTLPDRGWVQAACSWLERHPGALGVEGPTVSEPYDALFAHSVDAPGGGCWTCNVAYRREVLAQVGGFWEGFPFAAGEDLDLGYRVLDLGAVGFAGDMRVRHPPRPIGFAALARKGRYMSTQVAISLRHPRRHADHRPAEPRLDALLGPARWGLRYARDQGVRHTVRVMPRLGGIVAAQTGIGAWTLARQRSLGVASRKHLA